MHNDMEIIKEEISKKNYKQAISLLKKIKTNFYSTDEILFHFAKSYFYLNDFTSAKSYLQETVKAEDVNIKNYSIYYLSKIYIEQKKYIRALKLLIKTKNIEIKNELESILKNITDKIFAFNALGKYYKTKLIYEKYCNYFNNTDNLFLKNKFLNEYELATKQTVLKSKPRYLLVMLSNLCNLKCIMCNQDKKTIKHLSKNLYNFILKNLVYLEKIVWQGGETLILPYIKDILIETSKYPKLKQTIITNFQTIDNEIIKLISKNNITLIISIDGATKKTYEKIRKGAKFEKLIENINKFNNYFANKNSFLQINFVVLKENYKEMLDILEFAHEYNFNMITFIQAQPHNKFKMSYEENNYILKTIPEIIKKAKKYNIIIEFQLYIGGKNIEFNSNKLTKMLYCHLPWYKLNLSYENIIKPECFCPDGKVQKTKNMEIWNSKEIVKMRKNIIDYDIQYCNPFCEHINFEYKHPVQL